MSAPAMSEAGNANSRDTGVRGYSIDKFFDASTGEEGKKKKAVARTTSHSLRAISARPTQWACANSSVPPVVNSAKEVLVILSMAERER